MASDIRWGYALNHWKPNFDSFVRREQHERAFKVIAACGFAGIELNCGTGRWDPLGRPESIDINFGSARKLTEFLEACGVGQIASYFFDPGRPSEEELSRGRSASNPADHEGIVGSARRFVEFLQNTGGSTLVVRPMQSFWRETSVTREKLSAAATCWNLVGAMTRGYGVRTALHVDCLCAARNETDLQHLLELTDPAMVGIALDTAELTICGIDPVEFYEKHHERVCHFHFKDTQHTDELGEYRLPNAERNLLIAGGQRAIGRWFWEMGCERGRVRFPALMEAVHRRRYRGWIIVESDQSPHPAASTMLNAWYIKQVLQEELQP